MNYLRERQTTAAQREMAVKTEILRWVDESQRFAAWRGLAAGAVTVVIVVLATAWGTHTFTVSAVEAQQERFESALLSRYAATLRGLEYCVTPVTQE